MSEPLASQIQVAELAAAAGSAATRSAPTVPSALPRTISGRRSAQTAAGRLPAPPPAEDPGAGTGTPAPDAPHKRHLHLVGGRRRLRITPGHRGRWVLSGAATLAVAIAFGLVYLHVVAAQRQFALDRLNTQVSQQEAAYQRLRLEVAQLGAPGRIVSYAESKLGMVQPSSVTYLAAPPPTAPAASGPSGQAPTGEADWAHIKSLLAGIP